MGKKITDISEVHDGDRIRITAPDGSVTDGWAVIQFIYPHPTVNEYNVMDLETYFAVTTEKEPYKFERLPGKGRIKRKNN